MLRYSLHDGPSAFRFKLAGELAGIDVVEVEQCWRTALSTIGSREFVVDVGDLTGVDADGRALLRLWGRGGAQFLAGSEWSRSLVESITGVGVPAHTTAPLLSRLGSVALLLGLVIPARAESPDVVLSRYRLAAVNSETVVLNIEAELPKLAKKGRLRVIRRMVRFGKPEYEVLESEGDRTVRQQVIARYLSADAQAQSLGVSSADNYKFRFIGAIGNEPALTYVYRITPKKKRVGLIQGELWIDAATGVAVHRAGRFVKQPSVFLRRVDIVQDTDVREGSSYLRITRVAIDSRLAGRVELTISERPGRCADIPVSAGMPSAPGWE